MRLRLLLFISLALNGIIIAGWFSGLRNSSAAPALPTVPDIDLQAKTVLIKTNVVVRRQNFTWEDVESNDYVTYIKNLRDIGCPNSTIRDIIVADVNSLFEHRRATEVVSADQQWWRSAPDPDEVKKTTEKLKSLETERRALLTRLLGPGWETTSNSLSPSTHTGISLTGPILGSLPSETKQAVYDIAANTQQKIEAYQEAQKQSGGEIDPVKLAELRRDSRAELAKVLNPQQMEEFLLRYSQTAYQIRADLRGIDLSPEEFRALFHARDSFGQQPALYYNGDDPGQLLQKETLKNQLSAVTEQTLGKGLYATFKLNQDPLYLQSQTIAQQYGAPPELVLPIYEINRLSAAERQRIQNDPTLTSDEKVDALTSTEAEQEKSLQKILSPEVLRQYPQNTNSAPQ